MTEEYTRLNKDLEKLSKRERELTNNPINKIAALDRLPQIEMTRFIWRNLSAIDEESTMRRGRYAIEKIVDNPESQLIATETENSNFSNMLEAQTTDEEATQPQIESWMRLEDIISKWGRGLKTIADNLDRGAGDTDPFDFVNQLGTIVENNMQTHRDKLDKLK